MGDACSTHWTVSKDVQNFNPKDLGKGSRTMAYMGYTKIECQGC